MGKRAKARKRGLAAKSAGKSPEQRAIGNADDASEGQSAESRASMSALQADVADIGPHEREATEVPQ
jgi:hypothetical protein